MKIFRYELKSNIKYHNILNIDSAWEEDISWENIISFIENNSIINMILYWDDK